MAERTFRLTVYLRAFDEGLAMKFAEKINEVGGLDWDLDDLKEAVKLIVTAGIAYDEEADKTPAPLDVGIEFVDQELVETTVPKTYPY